MNSDSFLTAAYVVTWVIHIAYIGYLTARANRVRDEIRELKRTSQR